MVTDEAKTNRADEADKADEANVANEADYTDEAIGAVAEAVDDTVIDRANVADKAD